MKKNNLRLPKEEKGKAYVKIVAHFVRQNGDQVVRSVGEVDFYEPISENKTATDVAQSFYAQSWADEVSREVFFYDFKAKKWNILKKEE